MRAGFLIAGAIMVALAVLAMRTGGVSAMPATPLGAVALVSVGNAGVDGAATLTSDGPNGTLVTMTVEGLGSFGIYGAAVMTAGCGGVVALLNPLEASGAGDASNVTIVAQAFDPTWWVGVLGANAASAAPVACGPVTRGATPAAPASPTSAPASPTAPPGTTAPVYRQPTPAPPTGTPSPVGS